MEKEVRMTAADALHIYARNSLSDNELAQVRALKALCDRFEGLDLKLSFGMGEAAGVVYDTAFLAMSGDTLVGYCSLDRDAENAELCGMTHPDYRRRRIGFRLFEAARASFSDAGGQQLFAICEDASDSGRVFLRMLAGQRAFSEHRMVWREGASRASAAAATNALLVVEPTRPQDIQPLASALARAFDQTEERMRADLTSAAAMETERVYAARLDGVVVGGFRLSMAFDTIGIYAFGIDPQYQRQGLGRRMLARACALALSEGASRVTLEVDTDNEAAIALYRSSGFETTTTYGYYIFSRTLLAFGLELDENGYSRGASDEAEIGDERK